MILVLLPGLDGTGKLFEPFVDTLSSTYTTQIVSYPEKINYDYNDYIEFVKSQLPTEEEYVIIAESFSGYIAYNIGLEKPKYLKKIVFVATFLENPRPSVSRLLPIVPLKFLLSLPIPKFVVNVLLGKHSDDTLKSLLKRTIADIDSNILYSRLMEIMSLQTASKKMEIDSIYLRATKDYLVSAKSYDTLKKNVKDIDLYRVEGTHLLLQSNPSECAKIIENSLVSN